MIVVIAQGLAPHPLAMDALVGAGLPQMTHLLQSSARLTQFQIPADFPLAPHEAAVAHVARLQSVAACSPLAAWHTGTLGHWCAWLTPCHWQIGMHDARMAHPRTIQLDADESMQLLDAALPLLRADGLDARFVDSAHWLVTGEALRGLCAASADRMAGQSVQPWLERWQGPAALRRLQNELQMIFHSLPLNDARASRGLVPVNAAWFHGAGHLEPDSAVRDGQVSIVNSLQCAAQQQDWSSWSVAWRELDASAAQWLQGASQIAICGERSWKLIQAHGASGARRWLAKLASPRTTLVDWLAES